MKSELERLKAAVDVLTNGLTNIQNSGYSNAMPIETAKAALYRADAILHPAPVYEEIEEIVGWVNVYQREDGTFYCSASHKTEADAERGCHENGLARRISCQPIKVTAQREKKQPVERSVTVNASFFLDETHVNFRQKVLSPWVDDIPTGIAGTLTFTWTDKP